MVQEEGTMLKIKTGKGNDHMLKIYYRIHELINPEFSSGVMFWVDYHRGMLYCDVFAESPSLRFVQLPGIHVWDENKDDGFSRQLPRAYRTVGVSRGQVKFIDIDVGLFGTRKTSDFRITTWSLNVAGLEWAKDAVVEVDDLLPLPEFRDSPLPRWAPEYPIVSKRDSDMLHCILRGPENAAKTWVVTIDVRRKTLEWYVHTNIPYVREQKVDFEGFVWDTGNVFCDDPFVCCDFGCLNTA